MWRNIYMQLECQRVSTKAKAIRITICRLPYLVFSISLHFSSEQIILLLNEYNNNLHLKLCTVLWENESTGYSYLPDSACPLYCKHPCLITSKESKHRIKPLRFTNKAPESKTPQCWDKEAKKRKGRGKKNHHQIDRIYLDSIHVLHLFLKRSITEAQSIANICNLK